MQVAIRQASCMRTGLLQYDYRIVCCDGNFSYLKNIFFSRSTVFLWTEYFYFQNNPKDLDPSYKTDLDLLDCFGRVKLVL